MHRTGRARRLLTALATAGIGLVGTLVLSAPAHAAGPNLVPDGDFATPNVPSGIATFCAVTDTGNCPAVNPTFGSWTVTSGSVDVYGNSFVAPPAGDPASTQSVDLDGDGPGSIVVSVPLTAGVYQVSFAVNGNILSNGLCGPTSKVFTYGVGANPAGTYTYDTTTQSGWVTVGFAVSIPADGNWPVFFTSNTDGVCGAQITDVSVTAVPVAGSPLADPYVAGTGFAALGALAFAVVLIRRRRAAE